MANRLADSDTVPRCTDTMDIDPPLRCEQAVGHDGPHRADWLERVVRWHPVVCNCLDCEHDCRAAWDHPRHGPHTLLSHDDKRYAGCRVGECEPLYRKVA